MGSVTNDNQTHLFAALLFQGCLQEGQRKRTAMTAQAVIAMAGNKKNGQ
jgi:hypothetical protein